MTSNIGSDQLLEAHTLTDQVRRSIEEKLYKIFRPEFLNRIDAIVFFKTLSPEDMVNIAHIQLNELAARLKKQQIDIAFDDKVISHVAQEGYVPELGARPLKRIIQQTIIVPITQQMLKHPGVKNIKVTYKKDKGIVIS
jgi:ATP-dependent Clp protease ATP-binding subunit ClpA